MNQTMTSKSEIIKHVLALINPSLSYNTTSLHTSSEITSYTRNRKLCTLILSESIFFTHRQGNHTKKDQKEIDEAINYLSFLADGLYLNVKLIRLIYFPLLMFRVLVHTYKNSIWLIQNVYFLVALLTLCLLIG